MFKAVLYTQLKWSRLALAICAVAGFALPLLTLSGAHEADPAGWDASLLLVNVRGWSVMYPVLALGFGLVLATTAWAQDHRTGHVHALVLPIPRWHFVLLRCAAGAVLLLIPCAALWIGALVGSAAAIVPSGLETYPNAVAGRFALAALVGFGIFFAISAGTTRTAGYVLAAIGGLVLVQVLLALADVNVNLIGPMFDRVLTLPGPFEVFTGRWMLIDV